MCGSEGVNLGLSPLNFGFIREYINLQGTFTQVKQMAHVQGGDQGQWTLGWNNAIT